MRNASWSAANQLIAVSLAACMWSLCPTALAQTSPHHALERSPEAAAKRGGDVAQGVRVDRVCTRLFDGRGEKVLVKRPGREEAAPGTSGCRADKAVAKPAEADDQVRTVAPSPKMRPITAGAAQVDHASSRDRQPGPIAARVSAGRLSATLVTGGTAMLLLQSSLWTYLLILGLPLWQHVDLLPIVDTAADDDAASDDPTSDAEDERAVTHVLDPQSRGHAGPGGRG